MPDVKNNRAFSHPLDYGIRIWRYMKFTRFVEMLENNGLFFVRADLLGDPCEGLYPAANTSQFECVHKWDLERFVGQDAQKRVGFMESVNRFHSTVEEELRCRMLISCWRMDENESHAKWKLYAKGDKSVCIRSTYWKLRDCLPDEAGMGVVSYTDRENEPIPEDNVLANFTHKGKEFGHEREVRAIRWLPSEEAPPDKGQWVSVDLHDLVEGVRVAPQATSSFIKLVGSVVARHRFKFPVEPSDLSKSPFC